jgi:hypothetical protein
MVSCFLQKKQYTTDQGISDLLGLFIPPIGAMCQSYIPLCILGTICLELNVSIQGTSLTLFRIMLLTICIVHSLCMPFVDPYQPVVVHLCFFLLKQSNPLLIHPNCWCMFLNTCLQIFKCTRACNLYIFYWENWYRWWQTNKFPFEVSSLHFFPIPICIYITLSFQKNWCFA